MKRIAPILVFGIAATCSQPSWAACAKPDFGALLGGYRPDCCTVINRPVGDANLRWVTVSWYGPANGKIFVLNCHGDKVAEADLDGDLGYAERLRAGPRIGGIPTIELTYISTIGTGIKDHSVALVQYRRGKAQVLWTHPVLGTWYPGTGGHEEERTSWRFLRRHTRIEAVSVDTVFGDHAKIHRPSIEHYCLRTSVWRYVACE